MHIIRLSGPWESDIPGQRVKLPADWAAICGDLSGEVTFRRAFHAPTGLTTERLWIVLSAVRCQAAVTLNGVSLGQVSAADEQTRLEVTGHLQRHNRLEITLVCEPADDADWGLWQPVLLEISAPAV